MTGRPSGRVRHGLLASRPWNAASIETGISSLVTCAEARRLCTRSWPVHLATALCSFQPLLGAFTGWEESRVTTSLCFPFPSDASASAQLLVRAFLCQHYCFVSFVTQNGSEHPCKVVYIGCLYSILWILCECNHGAKLFTRRIWTTTRVQGSLVTGPWIDSVGGGPRVRPQTPLSWRTGGHL